MKITSIKVKGYKNLLDCTYNIGDFNVLIGANNTGKSNLLEVFSFLDDIISGSDDVKKEIFIGYSSRGLFKSDYNRLQNEITCNTVAITGIQNELITLGIASIVNGLFTFTSQIISTSTLAVEIAKCFKLQGQNNLTGNITTTIDTYSFFGAKPSEIAYLSGVNSNIQSQLNNKLSSSALNGYLTSDSLNNYTQYYYVNSISSYIYYSISNLNNTVNNTNNNYYLFFSSLSGKFFFL